MIKCQTCGRQNVDGSQYCDECGTRLTKTEQKSATDFASNLSKSGADAAVFQPVNVTSIGIPAIADIIKEAEKSSDKDGQTKANGIHSTLKIERGESIGAEFSLSADESFIGRWDADNGIFPDVDLDAHDPEAKVSRRHARILREENGKYAIEDLGSTNGTFVNGLKVETAHLKNGDRIQGGETILEVEVSVGADEFLRHAHGAQKFSGTVPSLSLIHI